MRDGGDGAGWLLHAERHLEPSVPGDLLSQGIRACRPAERRLPHGKGREVAIVLDGGTGHVGSAGSLHPHDVVELVIVIPNQQRDTVAGSAWGWGRHGRCRILVVSVERER